MNKKDILYSLIIGVVALFSFQAEGVTRRGLVIGLGAQMDKRWRKINGDIDALKVSQMLRNCGYHDVVTLLNSSARKGDIVREFRRLSERSGPGDLIYIHFSGHGQRITDIDGDEEDGWDESWIPYDAMKSYCPSDKGEKHLSDDEIGGFLNGIRDRIGKQGEIMVVVDACHAGDSTREFEDSIVVRGVYEDFEIPCVKEKRKKRIKPSERWLSLGACRSYEMNQEYKGEGKLTNIIVGNYKRFSKMDDDKVFSEIERLMQSREYRGRFPQHPVISGRKGRVISKMLK